MASGPNTVGNTANLVPDEYFSRKLLQRAKPAIVHAQFMATGMDVAGNVALPQREGLQVTFSRWNALTVDTTPGSETADPTPERMSAAQVSATVQIYDKLVTGTNLAEIASIVSINNGALAEVANNAAETIDTVIAEALAAATSVLYAGGKEGRSELTYADILTPAIVKRAARKLERQNVPKIGGGYVAFIHPDVKHDLTSSDLWTDVGKYSNPAQIFSGEIGSMFGVRFIESSLCQTFGAAGASGGASSGAAGDEMADVYSTAFLGANAYGAVSLENLKFVSGIDPKILTQKIWYCGWIWIGTALVLDQDFVVRVESGATTYPEDA